MLGFLPMWQINMDQEGLSKVFEVSKVRGKPSTIPQQCVNSRGWGVKAGSQRPHQRFPSQSELLWSNCLCPFQGRYEKCCLQGHSLELGQQSPAWGTGQSSGCTYSEEINSCPSVGPSSCNYSLIKVAFFHPHPYLSFYSSVVKNRKTT